MSHEGDKVVKVNVRFDHDETVIRPSDDPLLSANNDNATSNKNKNNIISIDLEKELKNAFDNE